MTEACTACNGLRRQVRELHEELGEYRTRQRSEAVRAAAAERIGRWALAFDIPVSQAVMLALFADAPGRIFSRTAILAALEDWPNRDGLDRAVDTRIKRLRQALAAAGVVGAILTVYGLGYKMDGVSAAEIKRRAGEG